MFHCKFGLIFLFIVLYAGNIFALGSKQDTQDHTPQHHEDFSQLNGQTDENRAEQVIKTLAAAYPHQIESVEFRNGDWALLLRGKWYYYAGGRMLPENLLSDAAKYSRQALYNYPTELPPWKKPSPEEAERFKNTAINRNSSKTQRSNHFFDDLWRIHNSDEAFQRVKTIRFLGKNILVHYLILEEIALVEEDILTAAKKDAKVQAWIDGTDRVEAWNWRTIADTQNRSYHSYGLAIDILPKSLGGKETYWLWTMHKRSDWWNVSYNERFHPPDAVIKAFEKYGFIWGGKWRIYDTMHFEYRPELFLLSGLEVETRR